MATGALRTVLASLGGAAVVGASVAGLHLLQADGSAGDAASVSGALPAGCTVHGALADCVRAGSATPPPARPKVYRDGAYTVIGHYLTPGGSESIGVGVTLLHGAVTATSVRVEATSPTARQFQVQFASRYAAKVVARDITGLNLSRVAGASLTSIGFDDAIARIKVAAHV